MSDPASTTGVALAALSITVTGSVLGVQYDALLIGFAGGLVALSFLPSMTWGKVAGSVFTSSVLAGFFAPIAAAAAKNYLPWLVVVGDALRIASAAAIGVSAQALVPLALNYLRQKREAQQ